LDWVTCTKGLTNIIFELKIKIWRQCMERIDRDVWLTIPGECDIFYIRKFSEMCDAAMPNK
jgi:hypothetical protein